MCNKSDPPPKVTFIFDRICDRCGEMIYKRKDEIQDKTHDCIATLASRISNLESKIESLQNSIYPDY